MMHEVLTIPAQLDALATIGTRLRMHLPPDLIGTDKAMGFELAVVEAATNIVQHAFPNAGDQELTLRLESDGDGVVAVLTDSGRAPPEGLLENAVLPDPLAERGRGMWLIRQGADSVTWQREADRNVLTLRLDLS